MESDQVSTENTLIFKVLKRFVSPSKLEGSVRSELSSVPSYKDTGRSEPSIWTQAGNAPHCSTKYGLSQEWAGKTCTLSTQSRQWTQWILFRFIEAAPG